MICIVFVAGHNDRLEAEIESDQSGHYDHLKGVPKALLPVARGNNPKTNTILGQWWEVQPSPTE